MSLDPTAGTSEHELRERLSQMMADSRDPGLHSLIWDYREGKISRRELFGDPLYGAAMAASAAEAGERLAARGITPQEVGERLQEVWQQEHPGEDPPDIFRS